MAWVDSPPLDQLWTVELRPVPAKLIGPGRSDTNLRNQVGVKIKLKLRVRFGIWRLQSTEDKLLLILGL
jgi:hypothetical protein